MEYSSVFLKARAITFSLISLISFIWVVVLCVDLFIQWSALGTSEKSFLAIMLLSNTLTLVLLLVLLILPFRPWLDGARLMLLLITHVGIASSFVVWNAKFTCPTKTADEEGVCRLLNIYILIANWIIPAALMLYKRRKLRAASSDLESSKPRQSRQSILPIMNPEDITHSSMSTPHISVISQQRRESLWGTNASSSPHHSTVENKRGSSAGRSRLSKPLPGWMYY
ncbi:uncharacterized protein C8R40DRAFT_899508 [Lentinula edodes]|uniref:uncharacterized protein n=1 Tax=Lentinula edodes TaxID=5353 RepID=UPI001E8CAD10|nr:uncharacterized protein C8R40DRAFT_899508 [Lentinula edodes]KAH7877507.1 hypothetical protein C8R40DRAFT_899508 [Lentinula edodes]